MVRRAIASFAALLPLALTAPSASALTEQPPAPAAPAAARVIVQWAPGTAPAEKATAREEAEVSYATNLGSPLFQLVEVDEGQATAAAVAELDDDPAVVLAERDGYRSLDALPDDTLFNQLWGLRNTGAGVNGFVGAVPGADVDAEGAWIRTLGSPGVVVADIDAGYQFEHPDLAPVVWTNPDEIPANNEDDDGNGYVDDVHGYDFVGANLAMPAPDADPSDDDLLSGGHGVHTAGTIAAAGNNATGVVGLAPGVRLMPLRVCARLPSAGASRCLVSAIVNAINYAGKEGARVANMSLGGTEKFQAEVNALAANPGTLYVISAGNDGQDNDTTPHYPCNFDPGTDASPAVPGAIDNVLCVAATDQADGLASFSDWGANSVDLAAPGTETLSTYPLSYSYEERFTVDDFADKWTATGPDGGFVRTNEAPLSSFGVTDVVGAPTPSTVRESTSQAFTLPPNSGCVLLQSRHVEVAAGDQFRYSLLLDGVEKSAAPGGKSTVPGMELRSLNLPDEFEAGGQVQLRLRFTAGATTESGSGVWLDDLRLRCLVPSYTFLQGTSMAAPHVSGAAALLFSQRPAASVAEVKAALLASADPTASLSGKTVTGGRLNASAAADRFDELAPAAPVLSVEPAPPADDNQPKIFAVAEERSSVRLFDGPDCQPGDLLATVPAAQLAGPGYTVGVPDESVTQFSAQAVDTALVPNLSPCSDPITYTEESPIPDEEPPAPPLLTSTSPASPASELQPRIVGSAEAGSTVRVYTGTGCTGSLLQTGSAAELESPGLQVTATADSTAQFSATATDPAQNESVCSEPISYTHKTPVVEQPPVVNPPVVIPPVVGPPTPTPAPSCKVPKLAGKTLAQAKAVLKRAGCTFGKATKPKPRKGRPAPKLVVKSSNPGTGATTAGKVNLRLGPKPRTK